MNLLRNQDALQRLKKIEVADSTFAGSTFAGHPPDLVISKAKDSVIYDVEGRAYIDLCAGFASLAFGHNPDFLFPIWESLIQPTPPPIHGLGDVYATMDKVELLEFLKKILNPRYTRFNLMLTGSQAIEYAAKTAVFFKGSKNPPTFFSFKNGYHGLEIGALPMTFRNDFREPFDPLLQAAKTVFLDFPQMGTSDVSLQITMVLEDFHKACELSRKEGRTPTALFVEPIQGRGGIQIPPDDWYERLYQACREEKVLMVSDEIYVGLGRCGKWQFADTWGDILCLGKTLGGGMPLSLCAMTEEVAAIWPENHGEALHTGTFFGHPLSLRVGLKTLQKIQNESYLEKNLQKGSEILSSLRKELLKFPKVKEVRGKGLMLGIEFKEALMGEALFHYLRKSGVICLPSGPQASCLSLTPAFNIPTDLWQAAQDKIVEGIKLFS